MTVTDRSDLFDFRKEITELLSQKIKNKENM